MAGDWCERHPYERVDAEDGKCPTCRYLQAMLNAAADAFEQAAQQDVDAEPAESS